MRKLPIGVQDFGVLREGEYIYVDKTELIHKIIEGGKIYFLSRPRRFGKSLTILTLKAIFEGKKELFKSRGDDEKDLWIYDKWDWSRTSPVIHIPFAKLAYKDLGLEFVLIELFQETAKIYGVELEARSFSHAFDELIKKLKAKLGNVVILIDEYDKPIIDYLEASPNLIKGEKKYPEADANRSKLRNLYGCIKDNDANIRLFFMTGVSRFSQTGIFSHLNHLDDLTLSKKYNNLVGITPAELISNFSEYIEDVRINSYDNWTTEELLTQIKIWYNGYSWNGKDTVYNPFSLLSFFKAQEFRDFWFQSGSPKFLIDLLKEQKMFNFNNLKVKASMIQSYEIENLDLKTLFFQTGYLTIKEVDYLRDTYVLDYPNREVELVMSNHIIALMTGQPGSQATIPIIDMENAFLKNDVEKVVKIIKTLLKEVPYYLLDANKKEHFYHALIHIHFRYLGWYLTSEVTTSDGRMDAMVKTDSHIYILEFKIDETAQIAINQIKNKDYAAIYGLENKEIVGIGINFDTEKKTVDDWKMEIL